MERTAFQDWLDWQAQGYTSLPLLAKRPLDGNDGGNPASWEHAWKQGSPYAFVLESGKVGRYTYLGLQPASVIRGKGLRGEAVDQSTGQKTVYEQKPLDAVRSWMGGRRAPRVPGAPKWTGGSAGYWSYDVIRTIERLPEQAADDLALPDYVFMRMNELWIIDHEQKQLYAAVHTEVADAAALPRAQLETLYAKAVSRADELMKQWTTFAEGQAGEAAAKLRGERTRFIADRMANVDAEPTSGIQSPFSQEAYQSAVERIREYIAAGDVFQVNLSQRQDRPSQADPRELYEWLRLVNPSPYMGYMSAPDFQLVSASPELLVELSDGKLVTRPIAGTRRRGRTEEEDRRMADELLGTEKERAEHIMLVDLERNDLGRISAFGTVKVEELMVIEYYSHVMHLVSQVEGRLADGKDAYDVIGATFPGGTITGAPKIRTMEIIEELEPTRRGPYTGSMGWIDYNGDMEFNIIIRTMLVKEEVVHIQAGAGIVIDSLPEREYVESMNKAKALWKAIQYNEQWAALGPITAGGQLVTGGGNAHDFGN
ncbi:anthranilate synthase component I family protein [Paenibacillus sacheonensis]|uniref:Anthranilate synthase component I family protein n=1 Tax=Paenibacillus sacheonensis TaxID=742054 RepID=A0A7X5C254_9BACL|nr:anthranilate synthase component I family protein [Paenibacillus sacheonensis]MBM7569290.1 para-aminobenzoate synthetase component 1 [Paenibacillus sacheonensis]NBC73502.1 anthranilate synthase component I family protein [Paenibacillus sacheonensis]